MGEGGAGREPPLLGRVAGARPCNFFWGGGGVRALLGWKREGMGGHTGEGGQPRGRELGGDLAGGWVGGTHHGWGGGSGPGGEVLGGAEGVLISPRLPPPPPPGRSRDLHGAPRAVRQALPRLHHQHFRLGGPPPGPRAPPPPHGVCCPPPPLACTAPLRAPQSPPQVWDPPRQLPPPQQVGALLLKCLNFI